MPSLDQAGLLHAATIFTRPQSSKPTGLVDASHLPPRLRRLTWPERRRGRSRLVVYGLCCMIGSTEARLQSRGGMDNSHACTHSHTRTIQPTSTTRRRAGPLRSYRGYARTLHHTPALRPFSPFNTLKTSHHPPHPDLAIPTPNPHHLTIPPSNANAKQLVGDLVSRVLTVYALLLQATALSASASLLPPTPALVVRAAALLLTWCAAS